MSDYRTQVHFLPMPGKNTNVRCLNGSAHIARTSDIKEVTCPLCLDPNTKAQYWAEKRQPRQKLPFQT